MTDESAITQHTRTLTLCPVCTKVVDAYLHKKGGDIRMRTLCPVHGTFDALYFRDAGLYQKVERLADTKNICRKVNCAKKLSCRDHLKSTYNIMVNVTQRCNMNCPVCFASADDVQDWPEPTADEIFQRLPKPSRINRPNVVFIGGEPTLRDDLPELISGVAKRGFIPRLSTNGLKLLDQDYVHTLAKAGLYWIVLQFDGMTDKAYQKLRGRPLLEDKKKIIENCDTAGITVQLAVMVDEDRNADQIGSIIRYGFETPAIKWINLYPRSIVNRDRFEADEGLHIADMLHIIEEQTLGQVKQNDFLSMMGTLKNIHSVTGLEILRQKISTWPMVLIKSDDKIVPFPRLISPNGIIENRKSIFTLLKHMPELLNFQRMRMPENVLFLTMEKFHNRFAVDLCEASCCHMAYMVRDGFVPFDIYNCLYRDNPNW